MADLNKLTELVLAFRDARDWAVFHTPRNLAGSLSIEAAELLEVFQWDLDDSAQVDPDRKARLKEELADVVIYALLLAHETEIDLKSAVEEKIAANEVKYPVDRSKGRSTKYTEL